MCAFKTSLVVVHEGCSKDLVEHDSFKCLCRYVAEREAQHQIKLYAVEPTNGFTVANMSYFYKTLLNFALGRSYSGKLKNNNSKVT